MLRETRARETPCALCMQGARRPCLHLPPFTCAVDMQTNGCQVFVLTAECRRNRYNDAFL